MAHDERKFSFERLEVWQLLQEMLKLTHGIANALPRPYGDLADQMRRSSQSAVANFAEGIGKDGRDQARYFRIARGSTYETAAHLESARTLELVADSSHAPARARLLSIAAILTRLILKNQ